MSVSKLSYKEFLESFKKVPRVAVSIVVFNQKNEILLTKRKEDPLKDFWHLPGSFIIKNESIRKCIERILEEELGFNGNLSFEFTFVYEDLDKDPRGHVIELIYKVKVDDESILNPVGRTKELEFFKKIPSKMGFGHEDVLKKLGYGI